MKSNDELTSSSASSPDPSGLLSDKVLTNAITSANAVVAKAIMKSETSQNKKGPYLYLTDV